MKEFACSDGTGVSKLDPLLAPLPAYLGVLGIPGLTAYFGLLGASEGGVRAFPDVLPKLFTGENIGKLILAVP